ncbi:MAG: gamma carbonic anhydrase family protein [Xanthobacteraceae bacterium]|jgi:carbonic anhydrase/acetyltransferase-like protein (isoleucine patch superfamily)
MPIFSLREEKPDMAPSGQCYVADTAVVIGKVRIKIGASVWFGAVLRGDNEWIEIGERTNIQDNCTLHVDPGFPLRVGDGCTIGHNSILHGCSIGNNTLIGMGAILLNGAQVGSNCIVGAGALVVEKMIVADNTLVVGAPARKIRNNDDATVRLIEQAAEIYFERWQTFASALKRVL